MELLIKAMEDDWSSIINIKYYYYYCTAIVTDSVGIFGLMANLTVVCERDVAHLNFSTGGNIVRSLRAAQECTVLNTNETIFDQDPEVHTIHNIQLMIKKN